MSTILQAIGLATLYGLGVVAVLFLTAYLIGTFVKGGLEVLALMNVVLLAEIIIGATVGVFLLGWLLHG